MGVESMSWRTIMSSSPLVSLVWTSFCRLPIFFPSVFVYDKCTICTF
jgi:hypothetical protein